MAKVKVRLGSTINLGDFENVRLDIEIEDDVRPIDDNRTQNALDRVYEMVEINLVDKIEKLTKKKWNK